ncbi:MAG: hypothetical protein ACK5L3_10925 [Oscillospiraceae bacterium]
MKRLPILIAGLFAALLLVLLAIGVILAAQNSSAGISLPGSAAPSLSISETTETGNSEAVSATTPAATAEFIAGHYGTEVAAVSTGETFLGMELVYLEIIEGEAAGDASIIARFAGEVTLRGELFFTGETDESPLGYCYLSLDDQSAEMVPRLALNSWVNSGEHKESLDLSIDIGEVQQRTGLKAASGVPCEIVVSTLYLYHVIDSDAIDSAEIKSISLL